MLKKLTLFAIFIALVLIGFAARDSLTTTFFEWYLKGYCRTCLGSRLSYKSFRYSDGQWVLEHPVLTTKKRLEEGGYRCQAELATVKASLSWMQRTLTLSINAEDPHLDIGKSGQDLRAILLNPSQTFSMLEVHTEFCVPKGAVFVHDFTEDHLVPIPLFFHINLTCKDKQEGCASLWMGEKNRADPSFQAVFSENQSQEPRVAFEFHDLDFPNLQQILRGFWPEYKNIEVSKGSVNGKVNMVFPLDSPYFFEGGIAFKDLTVNHKELEWLIGLPEIDLTFTPEIEEVEGKKVIKTTGNLSIKPSDSEIVFDREKQPFWRIENIGGLFTFDESFANFSLSGKVWNKEKYRNLNINGNGRFGAAGQAGFFIDTQLTGDKEANEHTDFHFYVQELGDQWNFGEVELSGFGCEELDFIQYLISKNYPQWKCLHLEQGIINAAIVIYLKGFHLSEVKVERLVAHHLNFSFDPWNLYAGMESAKGSLSFDLSQEDPLTTFNTDLKIKQGTLNLEGVDKASWQSSGIDANLTISNGKFQNSLLKGIVAGLKAQIELDGTSQGPLVAFNFEGKVKDAADALPDSIRKGLEKKFISDQLRIVGEAKKTEEGLLFKGKIGLKDCGKQEEKIDFGFILSNSFQEFWKKKTSQLCAEDYLRSDFDSLHAEASANQTPLYSACHHLITDDFGFSTFTIKDGWFRTGKLPLNKYLSPFLFQNNQMELEGIGEFFGQLNEQKWVVNYDAENLVLESPDFAIEIKSLSESHPLSSGPYPAAFIFDLNKKTSINAFLIRNGTYFEKNSGLLYTEINAALMMEDATAHFEDLTTYCNGLFFSGSADIDWSMPGEGVFEVDIHAEEMHGKISQLQHLLSHLNKNLAFLKIPIEGNAGLHNEGGSLHFSFQKEGYEIESSIQGTMTDAVIDAHPADMSLQELSMNFSYHHKRKNLEFFDIQGTLLVGKPNHVEEYALSGDKIKFSDFSSGEGEFDVWVGDKMRDIVRLSGKTRPAINNEGVPFIDFIFNKSLTHFGNVHPSIFQLGIKEWSQLEQFKLSFNFSIETLLSDLKRFSRTGLFFLSRGLLKELNEVENVEGFFQADLQYDPLRSVLNYRIDGLQVSFGRRIYSNFVLSGTKKGSLWSVDQLQFDDLSLAFDVLKEGSLWNIDFLGARMGDFFLIGMEGQYFEDDSRLEAKINLFEADISKLNELELVFPVSSLGLDLYCGALNSSTLHRVKASGFERSPTGSYCNIDPFAMVEPRELSRGAKRENSTPLSIVSGQFKASGFLSAGLDKTHVQGLSLDLQLNGSLTKPRFKNLYFEDIKNLSFRYDSKKGCSLGNVNMGIKSFDSDIQAGIFLQQAGFCLANRELLIEGLHFDIPFENLPWVAQSLYEHFPDKINGSIAEMFRKVKNQGSLQGSLRFSTSDSYSSFRLYLNDGLYQFMGREHDLSGLVVDYDPFSLKVFTEYHYKKQRFRLNAHISDSSFSSGEIMVSDLSEKVVPSSPLNLSWKVHPLTGYYIDKLSGNLSGIMFDLVQDPEKPPSAHSLDLIGKLDVNFRKAVNLLEEATAAKIADLKLGNGYSAEGQWSILKEPSKQIADSLFFKGELSGRDFEFYGYRFHNLSARLAYSPKTSYIRNLAIADTCGSMNIEQIDFFHQGNGVWQASIPEAIFKEFRPSLLNPVEAPPHRISKSLVIRNLTIKDVKGYLGDRNSFKGTGQLAFANPPKKHLQYSFLAIPVELLTRIGLDLAVLTPVRGTIIFDIRDGKAILKRFKDVYSKGKLSKFYLSSNRSESYVDFDGNLNIQVRMNQYNIFFKLAELFTFTVQGTLKKPSYALLKQQKQEETAR